MKVIATENKPIKLWLEDIEDGALEQARNLANLPFTFKHIALMPDCHQGFGMPIGGVLATKAVIIPNAVGVDIGCGMCAQKTKIPVKHLQIDSIKAIIGRIRELVPVGFNHHKDKQDLKYMPQPNINLTSTKSVVMQEWEKAQYQIGTLGGGNHFIELQKDIEGFLWVMIHSGSRNLGKTVADVYNKKAKELNATWFSSVEASKDLAFLPLDTQEAKDYLQEMNYCVEFALANRKLMLERCKQAIMEVVNCDESDFTDFINIPHNYARFENHFGENVIVHRKGATSAKKGEIGIIPGSQGTKSYIVEGLGNSESFESCSHGSGRLMGRNVAIKTLDLEAEKKMLDDQGIVHAIRNAKDLDEAPGSYKDIHTVMDNQKDLVKILVELSPLGVIKG